MEMTHNAASWIEIPVVDFDRAKKFYSAIFDYEMPEMQMGPFRMGFLLYQREMGGVGVAIVAGEGYKVSADGPKVYLNGGNDLNTVLARIPAANGKVLMEKTMIAPDMGYMANFEDVEGNNLWLFSMN